MGCTVIPLVKIVGRCRRLWNEALPQHIVRRVLKNFLSIKALRTVSVGELGRIILNRVGGRNVALLTSRLLHVFREEKNKFIARA